jgi:glycosyltransferase involved in cell wall biosynthesis
MVKSVDLKISVITACFNAESTIAVAVNSLRSQEYSNYEHVVIDGASSDNTLLIVKDSADFRTVVVSEDDNGIYDALNKGITLSTGEVIGFLHADDSYQDKELFTIVAEAFEDKSVSAVYGDLVYVSKGNSERIVRRWRSSIFKNWKINFGWMPPHPTLFVRADWYKKKYNFDTTYQISADYENILRLFGDPLFTTRYIPRVFTRMRVGGASNKSLKNIFIKLNEDYFALRSNEFSAPHAILALTIKNISKIKQLTGW